jgi:hypothetical protein
MGNTFGSCAHQQAVESSQAIGASHWEQVVSIEASLTVKPLNSFTQADCDAVPIHYSA